jgi:hypothetical protein
LIGDDDAALIRAIDIDDPDSRHLNRMVEAAIANTQTAVLAVLFIYPSAHAGTPAAPPCRIDIRVTVATLYSVCRSR